MNSVLFLSLYGALMVGHFAAEPARWRLLFWDSCSWRFPKWFHLHNVTALLSYLLPAKLGIPLRLGLIKQDDLVKLFKKAFLVVKPVKPKASRDKSTETFLVGIGLKGVQSA